MDNFSTMKPIFLVPLGDEPEEEHVLMRFLDMLTRSEVLGLIPDNPAPDGFGGRPSIEKSALLAVILYSFSDREGSARKTAESCRFDMRYQYLLSGSRPEKSTICSFISRVILPNADRIFQRITSSIMAEMRIDPLSEVFIDGSKFEANANKYKFVWKPTARMQKLLDRAKTMSGELGIAFPTKCGRPYSLAVAKLLGELDGRLRLCGKDPSSIVTGSGIRNTPLERQYIEINKILQKMLAYEEEERICGQDRNSYYKTDSDATAMCLKEDYYSGKGSNMHAAYNVQLAVNNGIIVDFHVSQHRSDARTLPVFADKISADWGSYPRAICADAGYGSLENYRFLHDHGIANFVKFPSWEGEVSGYAPALIRLDGDGEIRCLDNRVAEEIPAPRHPRFSDSRFYRIKSCRGCVFRKYCRRQLAKKTGGIRTFETSRELLAYKEEAKGNLLSPKGIELRVNRSIQVEGTFGIIKQDIGYERFRRRGMDKVRAEMMLICLGANLRKYFRFVRTGKIPDFWKAPENLMAEQQGKISCSVRRGGRSRKNLKKQPNQIAKRQK